VASGDCLLCYFLRHGALGRAEALPNYQSHLDWFLADCAFSPFSFTSHSDRVFFCILTTVASLTTRPKDLGLVPVYAITGRPRCAGPHLFLIAIFQAPSPAWDGTGHSALTRFISRFLGVRLFLALQIVQLSPR